MWSLAIILEKAEDSLVYGLPTDDKSLQIKPFKAQCRTI